MNILSLLSTSVTAPKDLWTILINAFQSGIHNFGWVILLLTILVKLVLSPLDFGVKYTTKMQNLVQQKCAPEVAKIKKKFGADQQRVRIQTQSLYKREGMRTGVSCIVMLVNLVMTMVVFFTFYASLQKNTTYQAIKEYELLNTTYVSSFDSAFASFNDSDDITLENAREKYNEYYEADKWVKEHQEGDEGWEENNAIIKDQNTIDALKAAKETAEKATINVWNDSKANWLWIDNIWVSDSTTRPFPTYDSLHGKASGKFKDENGNKLTYKNYIENNIDKEEYGVIEKLVNEQGGRTKNGYYILAVLAAVVTFLSQYITELHTRLKNKKANIVAKAATDSSMGVSMKIMKIVMPIIMIIFVLTSSASFGIYILASNIATIALGELITLIINKLTKKKQTEVEEFLEKEANRLIKKGKLQEK